MSTEFPEDAFFDLDVDDPRSLDRVLEMLFGPEPEIKVPARITVPSLLALEYICLNDQNYAAFVEFLKVRVPDTIDSGIGIPTIEDTRSIITSLCEADPTLRMIS